MVNVVLDSSAHDYCFGKKSSDPAPHETEWTQAVMMERDADEEMA